MKIGILETGHPPDDIRAERGTYREFFAQLLGGQGLSFEGYAVVDGIFPDGVDAADGWLITGSKHGAYDQLDWIPQLEQFVRDVYADGRPMVGVCFGHQIIAQALGGRVEKFRDGWAIGQQIYDMDDGKLSMNAWHQDQVVELPTGAKVVGSNPFCENAALIYGDRAFTVQAHPEFEAEIVESLINTRGRGVVPDQILDEALTNLPNPTQNQTMADRMAAFFKRGA